MKYMNLITINNISKKILKIIQSNKIFILIFILGTFFFFWHLDYKSLWLDESMSVYYSISLKNLFGAIISYESNMWFYYFLLYIWLHLGSTEFTIRALSALFAVITIIGVYWLGNIIKNRQLGLIAAGLFIINTYTVTFSQEARSYSLLACLLTYLSIFFYYCLIKGSHINWIYYTILALLSIYTHIYAIIIIMLQLILIYLFKKKTNNIHLFLSIASIILFSVPLLLLAKRHLQNIAWIPQPIFYDFYKVLLAFTSQNIFLLVIFLILIFWGIWKVTKVKNEDIKILFYRYLLLWAFFPIIFLYIFSIVIKPVFMERYFAISIVGFILLVATGIESIKNNYIKCLLSILIFIISIYSLQLFYKNVTNENWKNLGNFIQSNREKEDKIIIYPNFTYAPVWYYVFDKVEVKAKSKNNIYIHDYLKNDSKDLYIDDKLQLEKTVMNTKRLWFITSHDEKDNGRILAKNQIIKYLDKKFIYKKERHFQGSLKLYFYSNE